MRDILLIAGFNLQESLRTRRALAFILLYLIGATLSSFIYVKVNRSIQDKKAEVFDRGSFSERVTGEIALDTAQDKAYGEFLKNLAEDESSVDYLKGFPSMVVIFFWLSLGFLPWLIALTSYDQVAGDLHLRTIRYVALRTTRANFVVGKLLSQTVLLIIVSTLAMVPVLALGARELSSFELWPTVKALGQHWPATIAYAIAFVGLASACSQVSRTPGAAAALVLVATIVLAILGAQTKVPYINYLSPFALKTFFYRESLLTRVGGMAGCVALGILYAGQGFLYFRRRDL